MLEIESTKKARIGEKKKSNLSFVKGTNTVTNRHMRREREREIETDSCTVIVDSNHGVKFQGENWNGFIL